MQSLLVAVLLLHAMPASAEVYDLGALSWRNIGPDRGGRSLAAAGSARRPLEYYFGATGGGLWKTTDGGINWRPVTDGQIHSSSVGALAVAESNPDVVYIGTGETQLRGSIIQGDGVYRTTVWPGRTGRRCPARRNPSKPGSAAWKRRSIRCATAAPAILSTTRLSSTIN
jgi:hypothetical protein